jgi:putative membrane-bound dehydrogenase-like protein
MKVLHFKLLSLPFLTGLLIFSSCQPKTPDEQGIFQLPSGFTMEPVVSGDLIAYPMFATFDDRGRLFVFESTESNEMGTDSMLAYPTYQIRLLEDRDDDGIFDKSTIYADGIPFPMGGTWFDGSLYVAAAPDLLKYTDVDDDGRADSREVVLTGWTLNSNGAILSGPFRGPDGWLYLADARRGFEITTREGMVLSGKGARIWRCLPDGSQLESMCGGGFDNSIEIIFMPSGETIGTMTYFRDPQDGQRDALMHWVEGGVYPKYHSVIEEDALKLTGDLMPVITKLPRVAPSGLMRYEGEAWGEEFTGNLFSAEFNTGRIIRHIIRPQGASYTTEDEVFISSLKADIHPTDVLQDADGNLLVVVTGGWFIHGCPLSRVAKPEITGGIYRIRKEGTKKAEDPWGRSLDFGTMTAAKTIELLSGERPLLATKASDVLVHKGPEVLAELLEALDTGPEQTRLATIFILYRINTPESIAIARAGLFDKSAKVRTATARVLGMVRDQLVVEDLIKLLRDETPQVRRQAATALGQIGDPAAVHALLNATTGPQDRFVEHAIIYALISLGQTGPLMEALADGAASVRRAALIALDQMENGLSLRSHIPSFLTSKNDTLLNTGIWVTTHHPEWSDLVTNYLEQMIPGSKTADWEQAAVQAMIENFCGTPEIQAVLARKLADPRIPEGTKLGILESMSHCNTGGSSDIWRNQLVRLLNHGTDVLPMAVLGLMETQQISPPVEILNAIINNSNLGPEFRLKALGVRLQEEAVLSTSELDWLTKLTGEDFDASIRQKSVQLLGRSDLDTAQLMMLAREVLPGTETFLIQGLVEAFQGDSNETVGMVLLEALQQNESHLDHLPATGLRSLFDQYPESVRRAASILFETIRNKQADRLARLDDLEQHLSKGDIGEGRKIFFGKGTCFTCHAVGKEGSDFGPDLTNIGEIRSTHDLLEAIVFSGVSFAREYETYQIRTSDKTFTGIIRQQFRDAVLIAIGPGQEVRIPREDILSIVLHDVSLMPPGLTEQLSRQELSDLISFLKALPYRIDRLIEMAEAED